MLILLAACSKTVSPSQVSESPPPPTPPVLEGASPASEDAVPAWVGVWRSDACGERTYERQLTLHDDGKATLEERISPCPEGARCMWSGILIVEGTWTATASDLTLALEAPNGPAPAVDLPTRLNWKGAPAQGECLYQKGGY